MSRPEVSWQTRVKALQAWPSSRAKLPQRSGRQGSPSWNQRVGGLALCWLAASLMPPAYGQAQSNLSIQIPEGTQTVWSLNGINYTGTTTNLNVSGGTSNAASFQVAPASGVTTSLFQALSGDGVVDTERD